MPQNSERQKRIIAQGADYFRLGQLQEARKITDEQWAKLIAAHEAGTATPEDKRRYTLAYNGMRRTLKKTLYSIVP